MDEKLWVIDVSGLKMRDVRTLGAALEAANTTLNTVPMYEAFAQRVQVWPYAGDPTKTESYDDLTPEEWQEVKRQVLEAVSARFRSGA